MLHPRPCWRANRLGWILGKGKVGGEKEREKEGRKGEWAKGRRRKERKKGREEICAVVIVP